MGNHLYYDDSSDIKITTTYDWKKQYINRFNLLIYYKL